MTGVEHVVFINPQLCLTVIMFICSSFLEPNMFVALTVWAEKIENWLMATSVSEACADLLSHITQHARLLHFLFKWEMIQNDDYNNLK